MSVFLTCATGATAVNNVLTLDADTSAASKPWNDGCACSSGWRLSSTNRQCRLSSGSAAPTRPSPPYSLAPPQREERDEAEVEPQSERPGRTEGGDEPPPGQNTEGGAEPHPEAGPAPSRYSDPAGPAPAPYSDPPPPPVFPDAARCRPEAGEWKPG